MAYQRTFISRDQAQAPFYVGADLGGTGIKVGLVDDLGRSLAWTKVPTEVPKGPEQGAAKIGRAVLDVIAQAGLQPSDVAGVGLGSPGPMDIEQGMLLESPNLVGWENFRLVDAVVANCHLPVSFANDANAAAYGEFWIGCGRDFRSIVMLTLGTGVGGGIILDDHVLDGANSNGGECGHIIIDYRDDARLCGCHQTGHLEAYGSATAVIKRTQEALVAGRASSIAERLARGEQLTPILVGEEAQRGDALALEIVLDTAKYVGVGCVTLIHAIDPVAVVIGGAMTFGGDASPLGRRFIERIREEVRHRAFPVPAERVQIVYATLGGDAGYIGAAGIARLAVKNKAK
ncbi:MAG: ROK family protein [Planctomycetes bacterium]|nr:ROK family protein [Planctomycetota bacterium]